MRQHIRDGGNTLNDKQIAFITCVNDEEEYAECRYYLERLYVPEGYSMDVISIREAPSMAAGYNAAMNSSDAKYKVYLHQDVFVKNRNFIADLLSVFARDRQIGIMGMVGNRLLWEDMTAMMAWDTGNVEDFTTMYSFRFPKKEEGYMEVRMVDGLVLATQYDIFWREDLFDGWHFYDYAQCMEFKKAGYKVAVPWQESAWCFHDNSCPEIGSYYDCYKAFAAEYGERADFPIEDREMKPAYYKKAQKVQQLRTDMEEAAERFFAKGNWTKLREMFEDPALKNLHGLWDYEMIVLIDQQEEEKQSLLRFWEPKMSLQQMMSKLRVLKHALKRIAYNAADGWEKEWIMENYSLYAVMVVQERYLKLPGNEADEIRNE